ncbi:MAG TPA: arylsulfotransferase family protein [Polyangiaceae bacterium]|nr:arylsulfotransferase family protein [Polyangiaceae bacterium]
MTTPSRNRRHVLPGCLCLGALACGDPAADPGASGAGGAAPAGGTVASGATPAVATGGLGGIATGGSGGVAPGSGGLTSGGSSTVSGGTGGAAPPPGTGGSSAAGGTATGGVAPATGGVAPAGGMPTTGGVAPTGGSDSSGGLGPSGGVAPAGGAPPTGGVAPTGGLDSSGGLGPSGGVAPVGGAPPTGGQDGAGGAAPEDCSFTIEASLSDRIPTVGIVEWSTDLGALSSAQIVYSLNDAAAHVLNRGGVAPVDLEQPNLRTLLLGLKGQSTYTFHVEATAADGRTCTSPDHELTTGSTSGAPQITRTASDPAAQAAGFIVTCGGNNSSLPAVIIDADGAVVWWAAAPTGCSRARLDYEAQNLWMLALNVMNSGGEMRRVSMDGLDTENAVSGLSGAHHDFTVLPGGVVAALVWAGGGIDPESNLVERSPDGTTRTAFRVGANLYAGGPSELGGGSSSFHANSLLYHPGDDSYTIGDRNPNLFVKATRTGQPVWQFGGNCSGAPAPKCATATWDVNHGHHLLDDGRFLLFSNGAFMSTTPSVVYEFTLNTANSPMTATQVQSRTGASNSHSDSLGDVQRLPNGNTLVTFSVSGRIEEYDPSFNLVQVLTASSFGYADWRQTLYGPPPR